MAGKKPATYEDWLALEWEIGHLFNGAPIAKDDLFAGRATEVRRMLDAVLDASKHVVLYGERGVGKTSIANVFWRRYNKQLQTVIAARVQADPSDTFSSLWIKALEEFKNISISIGRSDLAPINCDYEQVTPDIIRRELQKCRPNSIPIIIIDEFDKLRDENARELTANVLKALYDYTVNATIILVGVAEDLRGLISNHKSLPRTIVQIKLERMKDDELSEILNKRLGRTPVTLSGDARWTIIKLSRGLPYYTQMLGKYASISAVSEKRLQVRASDVDVAMEKMIQDSGQSFEDDYNRATASNQAENLFKEVLLACALAESDESGFFTATNVVDALNELVLDKRRHAHIQRHMTEFISDRRGSVLIRRGDTRQYKYRFADPMMQPYVIIKGIKDGAIDTNLRSRLIIKEQLSFPNV